MREGNQHQAEKIFHQSCMLIKVREGKQSLRFLYRGLRNVRPLLELRNQQGQGKGSRRKQKPVPAPVSSKRGEKLAIQ
jgi:ribosomal protein S7